MATRACASATTRPLAASTRRRALAETAASWAFRGLQGLATWLPERWLETAAACVGDAAFFVIRWRRRVAWARVARAWPHLSQAERHRLVRASYTHLALALLWALRLPRLLEREGADALLQRVEMNAETTAQLARLLRDQDAPARSAIVTSGHVGVWELLPALLASSLLPTHAQWIVYRPLHNAPVNALVEQLRAGDNRKLIADKNCFRTLQAALTSHPQRPSLVGLVADQRSSNPRARCAVRFLGQETLLSTGTARLHMTTRAPLWFATLVVNTRQSAEEKPFELVLRPLAQHAHDHEGEEDPVQRLTQTYAAALEETVRSYPSQYLWIHDLWSERAHQLIAE